MVTRSPFANAQIDFSGIGKLYDSYTGAQNDRMKQDAFREQQAVQRDERARQNQLRQALSEGIPTGPDGSPDYQAMAQRFAQLGGLDETTKFMAAGEQAKEREISRAHQDRTFAADQAHRTQALALQREGLTPDDVRKYQFYAQQERAAGREPRGFDAWRTQPAAAPSGYRWAVNGGLEVIPGGPHDKAKPSQAANIASGIDNLAKIPNEYTGGYFSDPFASAIGSFRGQEDNGGWLPTISDLGKVWGSFTNILGDRTTSEVRNRIKGDTEALAAAIKPLIRSPGEGAWTDKDQERLVAVVGNLALANNREEYRRALEGVRDRVMTNFGIQLPPVNFGDGQPARGEGGQNPQRARNPQTGEMIEWNGTTWVPVQ